ncbi:hypothetical protein Tco_1456774 [Tanacetum coccineum]
MFFPVKSGYNSEKLEEDSLGSWRKRHPLYWNNALGYSTFRCNPDLGVLQIGIRAKTCLLHHLRLSTLPSIPISSQAESSGEPTEAVYEIAPMTLGEVNTRVTELAELHENDTQDLYALLEDAQEGRTRISQRVTIDSQRVDLLMKDRIAHLETILIAVHFELQTHREQVYAHESQVHAHQTQLQLQSTLIQTQHQVHETRFQMQQAEMAELREIDRRRQAQIVETLRVMRDMRR